MTEEKGALFLLPNLLGEMENPASVLPISVNETVSTLDGLIAEDEKECRKFLKRFTLKKKLQEMPIALLNEHTPSSLLDELLLPIVKGERWGLVTDAGLPCIADPGSLLVYRAHQKNIPIQALVGPSSIMIALMLSGLPGQQFSFRGYLDRVPESRKKMIKAFEMVSQKEKATQIFIETPYRNNYLLKDLVEILSDETILCVAWDLTMPTQSVISKKVKQWRKNSLPDLNKKPAVFLFL